MSILTTQQVTIEKLVPATSIAGPDRGSRLIAEAVKVTRFYKVDTANGNKSEYGTPSIEVMWGDTLQQVATKLEQEGDALKSIADLQFADLRAKAKALRESP